MVFDDQTVPVSGCYNNVLTKGAHYHTILVEGVGTIQGGILIKESAPTGVVRYLYSMHVSNI